MTPTWIEGIARRTWRNKKKSGDPLIPTLQDLAKHVLFSSVPTPELADHCDVLRDAAIESMSENPDELSLPLRPFDSDDPGNVSFAVLKATATAQVFCASALGGLQKATMGDFLTRVENSGVTLLYLAASGHDVSSERYRVDSACIERGIEALHEAWKRHGTRGDGAYAKTLKHPVAPLIANWQERPMLRKRAQRDRDGGLRQDSILPARLAHISDQDNRAGRLFTPAAYAEMTGQLSYGMMQAVLPGFSDGRERRIPALPLGLYMLGLEKDSRGRINHGGAAPLPLRTWVMAILAVQHPGNSMTDPVLIEDITLRQWRAVLWPKSHKRMPTGRLLEKVHETADILYSRDSSWPWHDARTGKSGNRKIVTITDIGNHLDDTISIIVHMPPGAATGPVMPPQLADIGAQNGPAYFALISLCYDWHEPGVKRFPVGPRNRRHWLQTHDLDRYPEYTDQDLIDLTHPLGGHQKKSRALERARGAIEYLAHQGLVRIEGRRIVPPEIGKTE